MQAFFADIYAEAKRAKPSAGHRALAGLAAQGKLQRHYTLNIDGLAQAVGLSTWHPDKNPTGASEAYLPWTASPFIERHTRPSARLLALLGI